MNKRVVLFLIDGCRPDALKKARTENIDALREKGLYAEGRTVFPSVTLPCHTSLFFSVPPERHGITTNIWMPPVRPIKGLFDVVHESGKTTAAFYTWGELRDLAKPGSLDTSFFLNEYTTEMYQSKIGDLACKSIKENPCDFSFVYLGYSDTAGHDFGFDLTDEYIAAIENADEVVGKVVETCEALDDGKETIFFVTADHGGHQRNHGTELDVDMTIPLVISGDGTVNKELDTFSIMDIAPTIAKLLEVNAPKEWSGKVLL